MKGDVFSVKTLEPENFSRILYIIKYSKQSGSQQETDGTLKRIIEERLVEGLLQRYEQG